MRSQTDVILFLVFNVAIRRLHISLTHEPKTTHYFKNMVKSLTEMILLGKHIKVIMNTKHHSLVQISVFFKKTKFKPLKSINFHFKTPTKQILVIFRTKQGKSLFLQKSIFAKSSAI